jgi:hypothetical protein
LTLLRLIRTQLSTMFVPGPRAGELERPDVTPVTRRLLGYWTDSERDSPMLFRQLEAAVATNRDLMAEVVGCQEGDRPPPSRTPCR